MALTGSLPATATAGPVTRCCRCNGAAKCLRCSCVRNNTPCSHCLPGDSGKCHNNLPRDVSPMALTGSSSATATANNLPRDVSPTASSSASQAVHQLDAPAVTSASSSPIPAIPAATPTPSLPPLSTISSLTFPPSSMFPKVPETSGLSSWATACPPW